MVHGCGASLAYTDGTDFLSLDAYEDREQGTQIVMIIMIAHDPNGAIVPNPINLILLDPEMKSRHLIAPWIRERAFIRVLGSRSRSSYM